MSQAAISTVSVAPLPVITASPSKSLICVGETATLLAQGAQTYTWTGLPGNSHTVVVSPPFSMVYSVIGKDHNGCTSLGNTSLQVDKCIGISENVQKVFSVYPNPATGRVMVNVTGGGRYFMSDQLGRVLSEGELMEGDNSIVLPCRGILLLSCLQGKSARRFILVSE
jgi:hypothetical protein